MMELGRRLGRFVKREPRSIEADSWEVIKAKREQKAFLLGQEQAKRQWTGEVFRLEMMVSGTIYEVGSSFVSQADDLVTPIKSRINRCEDLFEANETPSIQVRLPFDKERVARFSLLKVSREDLGCWRRQVEGIEEELEKRR